jgi:hypothetical protein
VVDPLFPDEAKTVTPRLFKVSMAAANAMVNAVVLSHAPLKSAEVPKLMFTTRTAGWVIRSQLSPEITCAELANLPWLSRTLMATMLASGATPTGAMRPADIIIPVTFVPCP